MGAHFLIDTNTVIDLLNNRLPPHTAFWLSRAGGLGKVAHSLITRIELLSWPQLTAGERQALNDWLADSTEWPLDEDVALETIRIRQTHRRKLPDAVIAATALIHSLVLVTRNVADFKTIAGVRIIDPHNPPLPLAV